MQVCLYIRAVQTPGFSPPAPQSCKKAVGMWVSPVRRFTICEVSEPGLVVKHNAVNLMLINAKYRSIGNSPE